MRQLLLRTATVLLLVVAVLTFTACLGDDDSVSLDLSTLRADFGMLHFDADHQPVYFTSDAGETYYFASYYQYTAYTADSTYRALVYYCDAATPPYVELYAFTDVLVTRPVDISTLDEVKRDPLTFQSAWFSANNSYFNIALTARYYSSSSAQRLFLVRDENAETGRTRLTVFHDQNDVPEYYSGDVYLSVPLDEDFSASSEIELAVTTYDEGEIVLVYAVPTLQ